QTQGVARENVAEPSEETAKTAEHRVALLKDAKFLLSLREELAAEEQRLAERRMALARGALEAPTEVAQIGEGLNDE
ncbi:hypothetical protein HUW62_46145, partial [Myxococcus sp. AM011]|uniref:hypothetical protein n=1 Tax=Myxococcus sp. AM011 TaxID=2745200 RepID=UPI001595A0DB